MPKLEGFDVQLDSQNATYKPGDTVTGKIIIKLSGPKSFREIRLKTNGRARVQWEENDGKHIAHYWNEEHYFNMIDQLAISENNGQITLPAGRHSYHFSFRLPDDIPCSFDHNNGWVQYYVKAILDRPWRFDHKAYSIFTVVAPYDSRIKEDYAKGIDDEIEHNFTTYCCFHAGVIKINVSSQTRGYFPGDTIELDIHCDSSSTQVVITDIELELVKITTCHAALKEKSFSEVLGTEYESGPFRKKDKSMIKIDVPSELPPSNLQHCSIIDVDYELVLTIHVFGMHFKITRSYLVQLWDAEKTQ